MEPIYGEKVRIRCIDSFVAQRITEDIYLHIRKNIDTRNAKNAIGLMEDVFRVKIMTEFVAMRQTIYSYSVGDSIKSRKQKPQKPV